MSGVFITFEGIDGCGKSTQLRMLAAELRARGLDVVTTREPGGTTLGQKLRAALLDVEGAVDPLAELLVFAADRAHHVKTLVRPSLAQNKIVISDRYADATVAYQGSGRGFKPELIQQIVQLATGGLKPDLTLLFDLSVAESAIRTRKRTEAKRSDRLDSENIEFHERVRQAYLEIAKHDPARVHVIDARGSANETHASVMEMVMRFLEKSGLFGKEQSTKKIKRRANR
ncbi:MAG TPA: dTMP kinase [Pyrinomonadaceae bacterium]|jgi:dTMP kinase|nr:dTMP kinase [Pyrinomonadaceae bacterium]